MPKTGDKRCWEGVGPVPKSWDGKRMYQAAKDRFPKARQYMAHRAEKARLKGQPVKIEKNPEDAPFLILPGYVYCDVGPDG